MDITGKKIQAEQEEFSKKHFPKTVQWRSQPLKKGHTLFEISLSDFTINEAKYEEVNVELSRVGEKANYKNIKRKVIQKENCIYISALNKQNALKKFQQQAKNYIKK